MEQSLGRNLQRLKRYEEKLVEGIQELERAGRERLNLNSSFVIEGETIEDLQARNRRLIRFSGILGLKPFYKEESIKILYQMSNMNDE